MAKKPVSDESTPDMNAFAQMADAIASAIAAGKPPSKKTAFDRKVNTPWTPKNGEVKLKLKRKTYHHGIPVNPDMHSNEEIALFNKLRVGSFCDNIVKVNRRNDKGIDIDYPCKTASQRLRLVNQFGISSLSALLQKCIDEAAQPKRSVDDFDN